MRAMCRLVFVLSLLVVFVPFGSSTVAVHAEELSGAALVDGPFGHNLIVNAGAENGTPGPTGFEIVPAHGWATTSNFTLISYAVGTDFPDYNSPGPSGRGDNFFACGPDTAASTATQTIDVAAGADGFAAGNARFTLRGFLGGFETQDDSTLLHAIFHDGDGNALKTITIGPVLSGDRDGISGLLLRKHSGFVPAQTRSIDITLDMSRTSGGYCDGYADKLSLILTPGDDVVGPTVDIDTDGTQGTSDWFRSDVIVTASATDQASGSGVASVTYWTTGAEVTPHTTVPGNEATLTIATEGATTFHASATDVAGNVGPPVSMPIKIDKTAPTAGLPRVYFTAPENFTTSLNTVFAEERWTGYDSRSGIEHYDLEFRIEASAYQPVSLATPTATRTSVSAIVNNRYQYRVRATDRAGNVSAWVTGTPFRIKARDESSTAIVYTTGTRHWTRHPLSAAWGSYVRSSSATGARATISFSEKYIAWVTTTGPDRGIAGVYVDGALIDTVDLYSPTQQAARVMFAANNLPGSAPHTLQIRVTGTHNPSATGRRVDVDAFLVK